MWRWRGPWSLALWCWWIAGWRGFSRTLDGRAPARVYAEKAAARPPNSIEASLTPYVEPTYFLMSTEASVFSHSIFRVQPLLEESRAMVKFSTGAESLVTFMSMRARSLSGPG